MIYRRIAQNAPSLGNAGKRVRATVDYTTPIDDWRQYAGAVDVDVGNANLAIAAWGIAVFVIITATAWCLL